MGKIANCWCRLQTKNEILSVYRKVFHGFISSRVARARSEKDWATLSRLRGTVHGRVKVSPSRAHIEPWVPREEGGAVLFTKFYTGRLPLVGVGGGDLPKKFFRLFGPQFCLKIRVGGGEPGPLPWIRHCSKEILDSWILDCSLWILDSGFLELNSRFQSPGLWIPEAKISLIYMGRQESGLITNWFCTKSEHFRRGLLR